MSTIDHDARKRGQARNRATRPPPRCRGSRPRSCRRARSRGRALVAVVAIMTFLASLTTGAVMLVRAAASRLAGGCGARGHHPGPSGGRPRHRSRYRHGPSPSPARCRASPRSGPIPRRRPGDCSSHGWAPACSSRTCRCRASSWCGSRPARRPTWRNCAMRLPSRCRAPASTTTAASSSACARWRAPPCSAASPCWCW